MTTTIVILAVYLVGCVLAYGKHMAANYEVDEVFIKRLPPTSNSTEIISRILFTSLSHFGFLIFTIYCNKTNHVKYWFKWSKKQLWKQYYENQK